ncbi:MAG: ComF family protein [Thermoleophilaceae bacterium]
MRAASLISLLAPPLCWACGSPARTDEPLCRRCRAAVRPAPPGWIELGGLPVLSASLYEGPARALVAALKYRAAAAVAEAMAARIAARADLPAAARLVPVPLRPAALRRRGYNQAAWLASALSGRSGLVVVDCLERSGGPGVAQVGRGRKERMTGPAGRIRVRPGRAPPGQAVLVDDVVTTGATLLACQRALREAGASDVRAVAFARTPGR